MNAIATGSAVDVRIGSTRDEIAKAVRRYGERLRDAIQSRATPSLGILLEIAWSDDVPVLLVNVAEGTDKPHVDRDNSIWFRTNATTRKASREQVVALTAGHVPRG